MKLAFLLPIVSPHEMPLANQMVKLFGEDSVRYIYDEANLSERMALGWNGFPIPCWCKCRNECGECVGEVDLLYSGIGDFSRFEERALTKKTSIYVSERWLKPIQLLFGISLPGILKLFFYPYLKKVVRIVRLLKSNNFLYFPQGVHAARDMARLCGLMNGDWKCLFKAPKLEFERKPGGRIWISEGVGSEGVRECVGKMRMWGYFVQSSEFRVGSLELNHGIHRIHGRKEFGSEGVKVLWVGRMLKLKRVDTIIKAVGECSKSKKITLDIYGVGPEEAKLKKLAAKYGGVIKFYPPVPINEVRKLMREHDVYVLSSNGHEGWGAVASEALEEGMAVIGTYEAGSSATILPESNLFHAGDWLGLRNILSCLTNSVSIGNWTAEYAANVLHAIMRQISEGRKHSYDC